MYLTIGQLLPWVYNLYVIHALYKPTKISSSKFIFLYKRKMQIKKIGHAGTLDPLAEGVLIVLTDQDTKRQAEFMHLDKEYIAKIAFGIDSPTYDLEGDITFTNLVLSKDEILSKLKDMIGEIEQRVPAFSAVSVKGNRLYKLARRGQINVAELPVRKVKIHSIDMLDFSKQVVDIKEEMHSLLVLECKISCGSGTYIRSIAHDLSGVLVGLVRTKVGPYTIEDAQRFTYL
jgi:tRNA pseudouridine55 synthase